jgi:DNA-binding NarL/FixJ family response regulator
VLAAISAEEPTTMPEEYGSPLRLVTRTLERHAAVTELLAKGYSLNAICRELALGFRTAQRFARAAAPEELLVVTLNRPSNLERFKPYVHQR